MYVNGIGFRAIERLTGVNHNTVINWVKEVALKLPDALLTFRNSCYLHKSMNLKLLWVKKNAHLAVDGSKQ